MGLQSHLSDVSSESFLVLVAVLVGNSVSYLRSLLLAILHRLGIDILPHPEDRRQETSSLYDVVGSGLAGLIVLCDQLNVNRILSYPNPDGGPDTDCLVCLERMEEGEHLRRLECRHVFHKGCVDGWIEQLNFSCPLCRAPMAAPNEDAGETRRRVAGDLLAWFPVQ